jgi:hypothetical protein
VLGVEACRQFIIEEFYKVLSSGGASVGRRHIELLADSMTYQGKISSVNRYGIDRNQIGPMAKASFEESVRNFFIAAVNGETDQMGVSASLMAGRLVKCGTGFMEMVLNEDMLKKATFHRPRPIQQSQPPVYARPTRVAQPERVYKMEKKEEAKVLPPIVLRASAKVEATPASVLPNLLTGKSVYEQKQILPGLNPEPVKEKISFMKKQKPKPVHKDIVVDFEED